MLPAVSRREFLRDAGWTVAGGSLAVATTQTRPAMAGPFSGKIKKAVKFHMVTEQLSVADKFKLLQDIGFDGVEPRVPGSRGTPALAEFRRASEQTGLPIHGVINSSNPDIRTAIDAAKELGGTSVLVVVPVDRNGSYLKNYEHRQQIIRQAVPHAEKHGIKILIENVWASFLIEPLSMARFVDELDSPMVGVYFDVGNNVRWGYPEHWIEVLGKRIGKLDIKEYSRELQNSQGLRHGFNVSIGAGSVDWQRVRDELSKLNFTGWATAEVPGGDRERLAEIAKNMDKVLGLV